MRLIPHPHRYRDRGSPVSHLDPYLCCCRLRGYWGSRHYPHLDLAHQVPHQCRYPGSCLHKILHRYFDLERRVLIQWRNGYYLYRYRSENHLFPYLVESVDSLSVVLRQWYNLQIQDY